MNTATDLLEKQADLLFDNIAGWEKRTLEYIGARIKKTGKMSFADVRQLNNMAVIKQDMDSITRDLAKVTGYNVSQIEEMYGKIVESQHNKNKALFDYRKEPFVPFAENTQLKALVKAYSEITSGTMINLSKTKALGFVDDTGTFRNVKETLYDALGKASVEVASGTTDFNTAMRRTIEQIGGSGIRVDYGGGITRRLDTVVRQNVLWGAKQVSVKYNEMIGEQLDCDGIEIDWHSNPRPSHIFMQGKQYSLNGKKTVNGITYESADKALEALEDYGCLHFKTPIILGLSEPAYSEEELKKLNRENKKPIEIDGVTKSGYEWKQTMRRLETEARKNRETITLARASGDKTLEKKCRKRLRAINKKYNEIADATGIKAQPEKMRVFGKTVGKLDKQNNVAKSVESGIINYKLNARLENIHNDTNIGVFDVEEIEQNLLKSNIGKVAMDYIEENDMFVTMNYDVNVDNDVCGEVFGKNITIYPNNCYDLNDVCGTIIHETAHIQYDWRYTQEDEVNCYLLEIIHRKGDITESEIKSIVEHVRNNYCKKPKGDLYGF